MSIRVRLTLSSIAVFVAVLLILWRHGRLRRLILSVLIVLLLLLHRRSLVCPSLILRLEFPSHPRSLKRFSVRDWIVRRSIHVFTDRDPTRAE